uniref:ubiquitinyl hydrolase 1 n=1 Tax=Cacopsylla melanoneura TaxID=428564 RepID=A0A8D8RQZ4_9HEMI
MKGKLEEKAEERWWEKEGEIEQQWIIFGTLHCELQTQVTLLKLSNTVHIPILIFSSSPDVSLAAIQYLNSYFMSRHLQLEPEFIARVMSHLSAATATDLTHQQDETNLVCIQRALLLLKSHLEIFRRRYAYHLRRWSLEGQPGLGCHTLGGPVESVRVVIHAGGYNDKICLELATTDFVADLRAEVTHWYLSLGGEKRATEEKEHAGGSETIRMITQGSELTMDYEEKTLGEIGFKDQQLLYISPGISRSKKRGIECPSALPPPPQQLLPTLLLLLPGHSEQLFNLMRTLSLMKMPTKGGHHVLHPRGQLLSRRVWDILMLLPTSPTLVRGFETLGSGESSVSLEQLIDPASPQKLMYSLCIVESLSRPSSYRQKLGMAAMKASHQDESPSNKWSDTFILHGGLRHLFDIFMSGVLQGNSEWHQDCLAQLLKLLCQLGVQSPDEGSPELLDYSLAPLKPQGSGRKRKLVGGGKAGAGGGDKWVIPRLTNRMTDMMGVDLVLGRINSIMIQLSSPRDPNLYKTGFCVRAQVVHYVMSLLLSWSQSCSHVREALISSAEFPTWLHRLVLEDPEPGVRRETCSALYRLTLGSPVVAPLFNLLVGFLGAAESMTPQTSQLSVHQPAEEGKEPYGPACRDYFWLMGRLVDNLPEDALKEGVVDLNSLAERVTHSLANREYRELRHVPSEDDGLVGMLTLLYNILRHSPSFKSSATGHDLLEMVFNFLFALPDPQNRHYPKCKSQSSRSAAYDLLVELVKGNMDNYVTLHGKLLTQHKPGPRSPYPWDYWPTEDERSDTGYVGLTNLGATCYLASCLQHLFLMSQARRSILSTCVDASSNTKHADTLRELQKMFAYLAESERKAYNPRSFCKAYTMDHQPLNTGEQKDMAEFFIDLVSKLEEMTPELKTLVKTLFGGVLSNNVVSLDCDHVSRTLEEFYTVRCQVADMRNLYESLDEVTLKDTLEGDNMYTCSQCQRKVRAEKRACFKKLPHILCFNTMRYTFNMVTMLKEKVNTHFSFPMRLDMSGYVEKHLMPQHYQEEKLKCKERGVEGGEGGEDFNEHYEYELIGVTVHTGTADGGHYYSFIRDKDKWLLFNDAEVKHFDSSQLAAECFGGEMTSKTYDSVNDKFMELNFEKTNSAYMLFYEWVGREAGQQRGVVLNKEQKGVLNKAEGAGSTSEEIEMETEKEQPSSPPLRLSPELEEWIWKDNMMFLQDKNIFEHTYFQFMWQMCGYIPQTLSEDPAKMSLMTGELSTTFFLETFIHSKEKPTMVQWVELLTKQFNASQAAGEWFLKHMVTSNWWPIQILIRCPNQMIRQMFQRLCFHVIQKLRESHAPLFLKSDAKEANTDLSEKDRMGYMSCVTMFIRMLLSLLEHGAKAHLKHLTEYFSLLYDFSKMGEEETQFLIAVHAISLMVNFYLGPKSNEFVDVVSDEEEEEDIVPLPSTDKYKPASLEKMITLVASLVEKSRGPDNNLRLSNDDLNALTGGKGFPFLYQQIKECINIHQTRNLIFSLCRYNERLSNAVISMMFAAIQKHANHEACTPFFKMFTLLTEGGANAPDSGMPCFSQVILSRIWEAAEYAPQATLDWLSVQVPRNKLAHGFVLQSLDTWPERFLIASNNQRVRTAAAYLLVSLVPNTHFRQGYRSARGFTSPHKEAALVPETQRILHTVLNSCLKLLAVAPQYIDATPPTSSRLVQYFTVLNYFSMTRNEKLMLRNYMEDLWKLFHPKLSEPTIPINLNKQSLLIFLFHASVDCPENIAALLQSPDIVKNLPFNYILADHDDHDVIMYNRAMLPAYYGLLRLCCQQSVEFRRHLASHQNIHWAFKNIAPHPSQYPAAVEELFQLMHFFAVKERNMSEKELRDVTEFKQNTLLPFFKHLSDGRQGWLSLISAVKNLVSEPEDRKFVIMNNGLCLFFEAFQILHNMYHETTGCHITLELVELMVILLDHVKYLGTLSNKKESRAPLLGVKDLPEVIRKIATLMNTYNPPEVRNLAIELLKDMSVILTPEMVKILVPLLYHCHAAFQESADAIPMGPYFPVRGNPKVGLKSAARHPVRPIVQMAVPHNQLDGPKGEDPDYDMALLAFYTPYHGMIDTLCRLAAQQDCLSEPLITLSAILGFEAAPLHFTFFPEFWLEIAADEELVKKYTSTLVTCPYFIDYAEAVIIDERILLNNQVIYDFLVQFFPKTSSSVLTEQTCQIMECLVTTLAEIDTHQSDQISIPCCAKLNAELRALSIVYCMQPPLPPPHHFRPLLRKFLVRIKSKEFVIGEPSRKKPSSKSKPNASPQEQSSQDKETQKVISTNETPTSGEGIVQPDPVTPSDASSSGTDQTKTGESDNKEEKGESSGNEKKTDEPTASAEGTSQPLSPNLQWPAILEKTILDLIAALNTKSNTRHQSTSQASSSSTQPSKESRGSIVEEAGEEGEESESEADEEEEESEGESGEEEESEEVGEEEEGEEDEEEEDGEEEGK